MAQMQFVYLDHSLLLNSILNSSKSKRHFSIFFVKYETVLGMDKNALTGTLTVKIPFIPVDLIYYYFTFRIRNVKIDQVRR